MPSLRLTVPLLRLTVPLLRLSVSHGEAPRRSCAFHSSEAAESTMRREDE
jgi:hypothetical protein